MKNYIFIIVVVLWGVQGIFAQNKILVAGSGSPHILLIDQQTGKVEWQHLLEKGEECNSVALTVGGHILYSYKKGAKVVTWDHKVIWDYPVSEKQELQSATLLRNGDILLGICGNPAWFIEVNRDGKEVHRMSFDFHIEKPHSQFRQVFQLKNGHYLVPLMSSRKIMEISREGILIKEYEIDNKAFSSLELPDGNWLIPCGDDHCYIILNSVTGEVIKKVTNSDIKGASFWFVAQIVELQNRNLLVCNWGGHTKGQIVNEPQLIELDGKGNVVWSLNSKEVDKVSALYYIDEDELSKLNIK